MFKGITSQIVKKIFQFKDAMLYQLMKQWVFKIPSVHIIFRSRWSIKSFGLKICKILSNRKLIDFRELPSDEIVGVSQIVVI